MAILIFCIVGFFVFAAAVGWVCYLLGRLIEGLKSGDWERMMFSTLALLLIAGLVYDWQDVVLVLGNAFVMISALGPVLGPIVSVVGGVYIVIGLAQFVDKHTASKS